MSTLVIKGDLNKSNVIFKSEQGSLDNVDASAGAVGNAGPTGPAGPVGPAGPAGVAGPVGPTILSRKVVPEKWLINPVFDIHATLDISDVSVPKHISTSEEIDLMLNTSLAYSKFIKKYPYRSQPSTTDNDGRPFFADGFNEIKPNDIPCDLMEPGKNLIDLSAKGSDNAGFDHLQFICCYPGIEACGLAAATLISVTGGTEISFNQVFGTNISPLTFYDVSDNSYNYVLEGNYTGIDISNNPLAGTNNSYGAILEKWYTDEVSGNSYGHLIEFTKSVCKIFKLELLLEWNVIMPDISSAINHVITSYNEAVTAINKTVNDPSRNEFSTILETSYPTMYGIRLGYIPFEMSRKEVSSDLSGIYGNLSQNPNINYDVNSFTQHWINILHSVMTLNRIPITTEPDISLISLPVPGNGGITMKVFPANSTTAIAKLKSEDVKFHKLIELAQTTELNYKNIQFKGTFADTLLGRSMFNCLVILSDAIKVVNDGGSYSLTDKNIIEHFHPILIALNYISDGNSSLSTRKNIGGSSNWGCRDEESITAIGKELDKVLLGMLKFLNTLTSSPNNKLEFFGTFTEDGKLSKVIDLEPGYVLGQTPDPEQNEAPIIECGC